MSFSFVGQPYAGSAQKMGSAPLKRYTPTNIRGNGSIVNKAVSVLHKYFFGIDKTANYHFLKIIGERIKNFWRCALNFPCLLAKGIINSFGGLKNCKLYNIECWLMACFCFVFRVDMILTNYPNFGADAYCVILLWCVIFQSLTNIKNLKSEIGQIRRVL